MEQNLPPLPPVIFENGLYYELRGEQYYPCLLPPESDTTEDKLLKIIIRQMAEAQGINEDLKARDQMAWVGAMNNIKSSALEILRESKYCPKKETKAKNQRKRRQGKCLPPLFLCPNGQGGTIWIISTSMNQSYLHFTVFQRCCLRRNHSKT